uniref:Elongator complex protein 1 n=1 Tax=Caenorhabditis tropicalis TaxID=1561998 RepID=A0A1I7TBM3_9PELO
MGELSSMANYNEKTISKIEFNFFKKFKMQIPENGELYFLEWNHNNNTIVCGGTGGALRTIQLNFDTNDIEAQALGSNQPLTGHDATVLYAQWNENYETIVSRDENGQVGVWHLKDDVWTGGVSRPGRCQGTITSIAWSHDGTAFGIVTGTGNVLLITVQGERLWGAHFDKSFVFCEFYPLGDMLMMASDDGKIMVYDQEGIFYTDIEVLFRHPLAKIMYMKYWSPTLKSRFSRVSVDPEPSRILEPYQPIPEDRNRLVIAFNCGTIQLMKHVDDENPFLLHLPLLRTTAVKWSPNGAFLAVCGTDFYNERHSRIYFVSAYGNIAGFYQHFDMKINAISWEACGLRIAVASDGYIWVGNVRPEFKWGVLEDQLVYVFQTEEVDQYKVVYYDMKTQRKLHSVVMYFEHLTCFKDRCVIVCHQESPGKKHNCQLIIGARVQNKLTTVYPNQLVMNEKCLVVTNMNSYFIWNYESVEGWTTGEYVLEKQLAKLPEENFSMEKRDIWSFRWCEDDSNSLVFKEKQKLLLYSDGSITEQRNVMGEIISFGDGRVVTVNFDNILLTPENPSMVSVKETIVSI